MVIVGYLQGSESPHTPTSVCPCESTLALHRLLAINFRLPSTGSCLCCSCNGGHALLYAGVLSTPVPTIRLVYTFLVFHVLNRFEQARCTVQNHAWGCYTGPELATKREKQA